MHTSLLVFEFLGFFAESFGELEQFLHQSNGRFGLVAHFLRMVGQVLLRDRDQTVAHRAQTVDEHSQGQRRTMGNAVEWKQLKPTSY